MSRPDSIPPDPIPEEEILARLNYTALPNAGSKNPFSRIQTADDRNRFFQIVGMLAGAIAAWFLISAILSIFAWWLIVAAVIGLAGYLWYRSWQVEQRQMLLDAGHCGNCSYDLRGEIKICPECGRDAALDEPTWKKLKRQHTERARLMGVPMPSYTESAPPTELPPSPVVPVVKRPVQRPPIDLAPIPVEGDE